jgi:ribonuclease HII
MITVGIDEVGRGCWAGPLVAGAVALKAPIPGLKDSKKLSKSQRDKLAVVIHAEALAVGIGWVSAGELDAVGLTEAVRLAMERALQQIEIAYDEVIIDGNINYFPDNVKARAIIKADDTVPAVSAASIVAKVARDNYMSELGAPYDRYGFEKHVGYGTALHLERLKLHGISDIHRRSFKPIKAIEQLFTDTVGEVSA